MGTYLTAQRLFKLAYCTLAHHGWENFLKRALSDCLRMALQRYSKVYRKKSFIRKRKVLRRAIVVRHLILACVYLNISISKDRDIFTASGIHIGNVPIIPSW